jgi:hypothetical protein
MFRVTFNPFLVIITESVVFHSSSSSLDVSSSAS